MQVKSILIVVALCMVFVVGSYAQEEQYEDDTQSFGRAPRQQSNSGYSSGPKPTPVPILKQINRHNEDGSYTYGYEGADGAFKIETKLPNGEVKGKYGYVDTETGKIRVVEYGANKYGFQPAGEGITVAPPTLVDETTSKDELNNYNQPQVQPQAQPQSQFSFAPAPAPRQPIQIDYRPAARFTPAQAPVHSFAPAPAPAPHRVQFAAPAPQPQRLPAPISESQDIQYAESPQQRFTNPQPAFRPQPQVQQPIFRPQPQQQQPLQPGRGGVLDQLAKDYALPQNSAAPLHDISFGYY